MSSNPTSLFRDATRPPKHSVSIDAIRAVAPPAASRSSHSHTRSTSPERNRSLSSERSGVRTSTPAARPRSTTMSIVTGRPSSGTKSRTGAAINRYSLTPSPHPLPLTGGEGKGEETTCERIHYRVDPGGIFQFLRDGQVGLAEEEDTEHAGEARQIDRGIGVDQPQPHHGDEIHNQADMLRQYQRTDDRIEDHILTPELHPRQRVGGKRADDQRQADAHRRNVQTVQRVPRQRERLPDAGIVRQ